MNLVVEIVPLVGITWKNKSINLLDGKEKVEAILGNPNSVQKNSYYYFGSELRIDFDENSFVKYIEFLAGIDGDIQPMIYGVNAFEVSADTLFSILKDKNDGHIDDSEYGYSYNFLNISVGIYRQGTPESFQEMIEEIEEENEEMDAEELEYEKKKVNHWATIGIGNKGYFL
ncbi:MAG TPA: hypothetical protein DCM73_06135 [Clostridiales bacterium]|nr:hypothetical protein [Clostridiales bacterium]